MNRLLSRVGAYALATAVCFVNAGRLSAQTAGGTAASDNNGDVIELSPFVVQASEDQGYSAKDTLAGTRVRTDLKDVASAISVVTKQFLVDTGAKNSADLLVYTPSTEVGGIRGNFSGVAGTGIYQENTISPTTRVRGLDSADNTRDYFLTDIPWDGFNVGRVDLQRGPNSILFGTGSPAGIINTSVNDASFKNEAGLENRVDEFGSVRNSANFNQVLVKNVLSVRLSAVDDEAKYEQKPAYNNSRRYFGALRFDPNLFGEGSHTSLRVKFENGKVDSNNPRSVPPTDDLSLWFRKGADAYGHYGYDHVIINQFDVANPTPWGGTAAGGKGGAYTNGLALSNQTRSFWPDIINYYEATDQGKNSVANSPIPSGTALKTIAAQPNIGLALLNSGGGLSAQGVNPNFLPLAIPMASVYYRDIGNLGSNIPGGSTPIPGGIYYANVVLQDPSIFNFYKLLGDGPNKHEFQKWNAFNVALDQTLFHDRLGVQFAFDHQDYSSGAEQWMAGENYNINVDINATYADGTPNPNVGRPYFGNGASAPGLNYRNRTVRDTFRFTPTYELRTSDFLGDTTLAKILGKHNFTGVYERNTVMKDYVNWAEYATTPEYPQSGSRNLNAANTLNSNRSFEWIAYVGPSLLGAASPAGANLTNIPYRIQPPTSQYATVFNSTWNKPTNPNDPNYVNPNAAYSYTNYQNGATVASTQIDNPANYVGWTTQNIDWLRASDPNQFPSLVESANRTRFRDLSTGITWQGYLFGGDFVPAFGWRKDIITAYQTQAPTNALTGYTSLDYTDDLASRTDVRGESKSWGGVYHIPKKYTSWLPAGTTVSVSYNRSSNFKADATRLDLAGNQIPNATGETKEYGVTITTLNDKLTLKVNKFKTKVANATLADTQGNSIAGLGNNAYFIADGAIWGWAWAASVQEGLSGNTPNTNFYDAAAADGLPHGTAAEIAAYDAYNRTGGTYTDGNGTTHTYVGGNAIVNAWLHAPFPKNFFASYSLTPALDPTLAYASGHLVDAYVGGIPGGYAGGVPTGGGSSFGNHQTTVDTLSKGIELELTYQPVKNWNITLNYSKVDATRENIDPVSKTFLSEMTAFMNGPGGQVREWYNGGPTLGSQWNSSIVAPYAVLVNELGHEAPEVAPWRFNGVSTYKFDKGMLKGAFFGGAVRIEAGRIIGYKYDPKFVNSITSDPNYASVKALTLGGLDVNQPFRGSNDTHVDAWVGYTRKIGQKLDWRIQLNIRDVGEKDRLTASRINPDGSIALARIQQGMGFQLTNSFDF
ncbi:MAG TPA: TonB-dependent receptor plug domain-containing protein [Lacunisphaera sp.]|nr:TonB-dependent receptor plug domain-containing protein [Lacunisphaera sp.]